MYRFAIIGCGDSAYKHAAALQASGKLTAVCDTDPARADKLAVQFQATAYNHIDSLLDKEQDLDIVIVCTPTGYHAEHTIKSLQAGKHVICERPFCITNAAAWQIFETARLCRRKLWIVSSPREYLANETRLKQTSAVSFHLSCTIGTVQSASSWKTTAFPGGNLLLVHLHDPLELIDRLFGGIRQCSSLLNDNHDDAFEQCGGTVVHMNSGAIGTINWAADPGLETNFNLEISDGSRRVYVSGKDLADSEARNLERIYQNLRDQISDSEGGPTKPADFSVIRDIEKIYSSILSQTEDTF